MSKLSNTIKILSVILLSVAAGGVMLWQAQIVSEQYSSISLVDTVTLDKTLLSHTRDSEADVKVLGEETEEPEESIQFRIAIPKPQRTPPVLEDVVCGFPNGSNIY